MDPLTEQAKGRSDDEMWSQAIRAGQGELDAVESQIAPLVKRRRQLVGAILKLRQLKREGAKWPR